MSSPLLTRSHLRAAPQLELGQDARLALARVHESCGNARRVFAMLVASRVTSSADREPIWWVTPAWERDQLHAEGVAPFIGPEKLLFARPKRAEDVLWTLEEILRSGTTALAVADIPGLPNLTAIRRLHLAAETGAETGIRPPLGLLLTPGNGGAQGVESRWHMQSLYHPHAPRWQLDRLRARMDPPRSWQVAHEDDNGFVLQKENRHQADMTG